MHIYELQLQIYANIPNNDKYSRYLEYGFMGDMKD